MEKAYFPMFIDLSEKEILIVGGGKIASRRVTTLLDFASHITVIAPEIENQLQEYVNVEKIGWIPRKYQRSDIPEHIRADIVLAATDDAKVNAEIGRLCREQGICVNVADKKEMCDFYFPSIVKTEDVVIGIKSGGENPVATKKVRKRIEDCLEKM